MDADRAPLIGLVLMHALAASAAASPDVKSRLQIDLAAYGSAAGQEMDDGVLVRRAQVNLSGSWSGTLGYSLGIQFEDPGSGDGLQLREASIDAALGVRWRLRAGSFSPLSNLDDATGASDTPFLERASPAEIARALAGGDGRLGISVDGHDEDWSASLALTGPRVAAENSEGQAGLVGRATMLLSGASGLRAHVGVNATWLFLPPRRDPAARSVRLADRPESRVDGQRLIDTGELTVNDAWNLGFEFALSDGTLLLQSEAFLYGIERDDGRGRDAILSGWYVQISRPLFGAPRAYTDESASFKAASEGSGLEVAARLSVTDLDEPAAGVRGGKQVILTLGLNWFLEPELRLFINLQRVEVMRSAAATGGDEVSSFAALSARFQFSY